MNGFGGALCEARDGASERKTMRGDRTEQVRKGGVDPVRPSAGGSNVEIRFSRAEVSSDYLFRGPWSIPRTW